MNNNEFNLNSKAEEPTMSISLFTKEELSSKKLTEITEHYNQVAKLIGVKAVKKFRDKPTSISRTLEAQETYSEDLAEAAKAVVKEKAPKKEAKALAESKVRSNKFGITKESRLEFNELTCNPKEGTIEATIKDAIRELYDADNNISPEISEVITYILITHKRPRSDQKVDEAYALHNIKWFIKKGHLKIVG